MTDTATVPDQRLMYLVKRLEMAERVWRVMKETDSRECRNCHEFQHMDPDAQERVSARRHEKAFKQGETCIDCHKGIAHHLPEGSVEDEAVTAITGGTHAKPAI